MTSMGLVDEKKFSKPLGTSLPADDVDAWTAWCNQRQHVKAGASVAAFRLFMMLPLRLREAALKGDVVTVEEWLKRAEFLMAKEAVDQRLREESQGLPSRPPAPNRKAGGTVR